MTWDAGRIARLNEQQRQVVIGEIQFAATCVDLAGRAVDPGLPEIARLRAVREQIENRPLPTETVAQEERQTILNYIDWALIQPIQPDRRSPLDLCLGTFNERLKNILLPRG